MDAISYSSSSVVAAPSYEISEFNHRMLTFLTKLKSAMNTPGNIRPAASTRYDAISKYSNKIKKSTEKGNLTSTLINISKFKTHTEKFIYIIKSRSKKETIKALTDEKESIIASLPKRNIISAHQQPREINTSNSSNSASVSAAPLYINAPPPYINLEISRYAQSFIDKIELLVTREENKKYRISNLYLKTQIDAFKLKNSINYDDDKHISRSINSFQSHLELSYDLIESPSLREMINTEILELKHIKMLFNNKRISARQEARERNISRSTPVANTVDYTFYVQNFINEFKSTINMMGNSEIKSSYMYHNIITHTKRLKKNAAKDDVKNIITNVMVLLSHSEVLFDLTETPSTKKAIRDARKNLMHIKDSLLKKHITLAHKNLRIINTAHLSHSIPDAIPYTFTVSEIAHYASKFIQQLELIMNATEDRGDAVSNLYQKKLLRETIYYANSVAKSTIEEYSHYTVINMNILLSLASDLFCLIKKPATNKSIEIASNTLGKIVLRLRENRLKVWFRPYQPSP